MKHMVLLLSAVLVLAACGAGDGDGKEDNDSKPITEPEDEKPVTGAASFRIAKAVDDRDNGDFTPEVGDKCDKDLDTGLFHLKFAQAKNVFELRIKNLRSTPQDYQCSQAETNTGVEQQDELGDLFNTCMVSVRLEAEDVDGFSGYDMYRPEAQLSPFAYKGPCTISVTEVGNTVQGAVSCADMIQTYRDGAMRNPVSSNVVATMDGDFSCELRKR